LRVTLALAGYKPHARSVHDSLTIAKLQLYDAAGNYTQELLRAGLVERLGLDVLPALLPDPGGVVSYDTGAWNDVANDLSPQTEVPGAVALRGILGGAGDAQGSNCWALAGNRTKSGKPMVAGDPHLPVRNASIWLEG